jgi:TRAP-type mannitol/chloroaromatic compound transport system substrate-binding protein
MGGWFLKEINSVEDFKGLKMRIPGLAAEVLNRMGGTAVALPGGEIMPALQSGAIDATEWVGPWNDLAFGFHKITKFYYGPGFHEPSSALECSTNLEAFNELDNDLKSIIKNACEAENTRMISEFTAANIDAQEKLVKEHGVIIRNFPKDVFNLMMSLSKDVVSETAAEGKLNKKIYESWSAFKEKARQRAAFNEHGYTNLSNNS